MTNQYVRDPKPVTLVGMTCAEATRISQQYDAMPATINNGNINLQDFDGWECYAPTAYASQTENVAWTCHSATKSFTVRHY